MRRWLPLVLLCLPVASSAASPCAWGGPRVELESAPDLVVSRWDVPDDPALQAEMTAPGPALLRYQAWGRHRAGDVDPFSLLRRQADLYHRINRGDEPKIRLILRRAAGSVQPMNCLEGLLFEDHSARFPAEGYNEFVALVMRKEGRLRVYSLSSGRGDGTGTSADHIQASVEADRAAGWRLVLNLHNHPFAPPRRLEPGETQDIGGTTVPSGDSETGDLMVFAVQIQRWDLAEAAITNGYDTVHMSPSDVSRLIHVTDAARGGLAAEAARAAARAAAARRP